VTAFAGFAPEAFAWFAGLEAENTREWFAAHRDTYEDAVRGAFEAMLLELADDLGGDVKLFRQHRDVRFSADKSPYKTRTYGLIHDRPENRPTLYAQISATGLFAGSGYYRLAADQLARFRDAIADDRTGPALEAAVAHAEAAGAETYGEVLKTAPRGYPRDHPRIALLRHKALVGGARLEPGDDGIGREAALEHAHATWAACEPLNAWLDEHVGGSDPPVEPRSGRRRGRGS
jgi:uncharacterized protein (TIGR02453 family)